MPGAGLMAVSRRLLPVGYGDGLSRQLSSRGRVIVRDDYAAMIGNISMNLTAVDVTGIPGVDVGDEHREPELSHHAVGEAGMTV